jgi:hypothetical protein
MPTRFVRLFDLKAGGTVATMADLRERLEAKRKGATGGAGGAPSQSERRVVRVQNDAQGGFVTKSSRFTITVRSQADEEPNGNIRADHRGSSSHSSSVCELSCR